MNYNENHPPAAVQPPAAAAQAPPACSDDPQAAAAAADSQAGKFSPAGNKSQAGASLSSPPALPPSLSAYPPLAHRLYAVWYRHLRVYSKNLISNGLPPFLEPLIFLLGIGMGLGAYISRMDGFPFIEYLASGLLVTTAMFTASFECSFGTFIRLEFEKTYDGMLAAPITANDLLIGEILWAGTKGFFFTLAVLLVVTVSGVIPPGLSFLAPFIGFFTGTMFGTLSLFVTGFVKNINHFNFYFSGFISPMFFFSGVVFPVETLPPAVRPFSEILPLTHAVRLTRTFSLGLPNPLLVFDLAYLVLFTLIVGYFAVRLLKKRLVD